MLARALPFVFLLPAVAAQVVMPGAGGQRFVDFSQDLASPGTVVAIGALGKWKEGKRERLADGQLGGGGGQVASVSGTQYFKVPVTATLQPRAVLQGKADGVTVVFDVQVARLPDGKEKRQVQGGASFEEDTLALFVFAPKTKKSFELRHVIPIDRTIEKGSDAEPSFVDSMRDYYTVNRRMCDLTQAIADLDASKDDAAKKTAAETLRDLLAKKPELKKPQNDGLLTQHVSPLEQRAQKRLAELAKAEKGDKGDGK